MDMIVNKKGFKKYNIHLIFAVCFGIFILLIKKGYLKNIPVAFAYPISFLWIIATSLLFYVLCFKTKPEGAFEFVIKVVFCVFYTLIFILYLIAFLLLVGGGVAPDLT